jgi:hypothetical protein
VDASGFLPVGTRRWQTGHFGCFHLESSEGPQVSVSFLAVG